MSGKTSLDDLLAHMQPRLMDETYVFVTVPYADIVPTDIDPVMTFREAEGRTLILSEQEAKRAGLEGTFRSKMITLDVHSSLEAVGFLAVITTRLAAEGMGVNPISAFYHDHLFVPEDRVDDALRVLGELSR